MSDEKKAPKKNKAEHFLDELKEESLEIGKAWWAKVEEIGKGTIKDLTGEKRKLAQAAMVDLAKIEIKRRMGQHVGREAAIVESTLQDLKAVVAIEVMRAMRDVAAASATHAGNIISSIFGRVLDLAS